MMSSLSPPIGHFAAGLTGVGSVQRAGRGANYLHGKVSYQSFPFYFPVGSS